MQPVEENKRACTDAAEKRLAIPRSHAMLHATCTWSRDLKSKSTISRRRRRCADRFSCSFRACRCATGRGTTRDRRLILSRVNRRDRFRVPARREAAARPCLASSMLCPLPLRSAKLEAVQIVKYHHRMEGGFSRDSFNFSFCRILVVCFYRILVALILAPFYTKDKAEMKSYANFLLLFYYVKFMSNYFIRKYRRFFRMLWILKCCSLMLYIPIVPSIRITQIIVCINGNSDHSWIIFCARLKFTLSFLYFIETP